MTSPDPIPTPTGVRPLTADPITHLVLNLCARTEDITRDRTSPDAPWRLKLRGERIANMRALCNLGVALTSLEAAGLIKWYDFTGAAFRDASPGQYSLDTATGRATLLDWDADVLAGNKS